MPRRPSGRGALSCTPHLPRVAEGVVPSTLADTRFLRCPALMERPGSRPLVIGAGVAGLAACRELERAGQTPLLLEASDRVGGRLRTEVVDGWPLDHGFQVLLTAYPAVQRMLDLDALELRFFDPGALVRKGGHWKLLGDPRRHPADLWPTLRSGIGTWGDRIRVLRLAAEVRRGPVERCFAVPAETTAAYLHRLGFTAGFVRDFFQPFYAGIFLEPDLATSARMFRFSFRMFAEGKVGVPRAGIAALPRQMAAALARTEIRLNTAVRSVDPREAVLVDGTRLPHAGCVLATPTPAGPATHPPQSSAAATGWNRCLNYYFRARSDEAGPARPLVRLLPGEGRICNLHRMDDLFGGEGGDGGESLWSVTALPAADDPSDPDALEETVRAELRARAGLATSACLRAFAVPHALPRRADLRYQPDPADLLLAPGLARAGDALAHPSLNAALDSGHLAAQSLLQHPQG